MKRVTPAMEKSKYGDLKHKACISEALHHEVIASRKAVFQVIYLRRKVPMGSNGTLVRTAEN